MRKNAPPIRRAIAKTNLAIGSAILLVACGASTKGSSTTQTQPAPSVGAISKVLDANQLPLPFDEYLQNPQQLAAIQDAYRLLIDRCMQRFGYGQFSMPTPPPNTGGWMAGQAPSTRESGYFGVQSMAQAQRWGYHPAGGISASSGPPPSLNLTPQMAVIMFGGAAPGQKFGPGGQNIGGQRVPQSGCVGEANFKLSGSVTPESVGDSQFAVSTDIETMARVEQDPRVRGVFSKWSVCMKAKGFSYSDPLAADSDPQWSRTSMPTNAEISTAVADQKCRQANNVVGVWYAVEVAYQTQAIDQHSTEFAAIKQHIQDLLRAAAMATGSGS